MTYHLPPTRLRKETVVKYSVLSADEGHRSVAVTCNPVTDLYSVYVLIAPFADTPWMVDDASVFDLTETAATSAFRSFEQRG